ncbi:hypothetical protein [Armatimonas sp.]|uniref:hypothetical protein n=1 Tax=Armatimonas sp. TaxID=1872638 RepID=UPI003751C14C
MPQTLEERVTLLEREMVQVKAKTKIKDTRPWWERRFGAFKDDPLYDEAVKAGEEYRKAQVPDYMMEEPTPDVPA